MADILLADGLLVVAAVSILISCSPPRRILFLPLTSERPTVSMLEVIPAVMFDAFAAAPVDMLATADINAASPPCESTIVVMQEFSAGGSRTRVIMPGTTSEKCLETNVDISDDLPTPSIIVVVVVVVAVVVITVSLWYSYNIFPVLLKIPLFRYMI